MRKFIALTLLIAFSLPTAANNITQLIITKEDLSKICTIAPDSYEYSEGGFPFIQDKYKVEINDSNCGIKANIVIDKFITESFAESKFTDLKESHISMNILLKPVDGNGNLVMWENSSNNKMVFLRKQGKFVFSVAINTNANHKYYEKLKLLTLQRYF